MFFFFYFLSKGSKIKIRLTVRNVNFVCLTILCSLCYKRYDERITLVHRTSLKTISVAVTFQMTTNRKTTKFFVEYNLVELLNYVRLNLLFLRKFKFSRLQMILHTYILKRCFLAIHKFSHLCQ